MTDKKTLPPVEPETEDEWLRRVVRTPESWEQVRTAFLRIQFRLNAMFDRPELNDLSIYGAMLHLGAMVANLTDNAEGLAEIQRGGRAVLRVWSDAGLVKNPEDADAIGAGVSIAQELCEEAFKESPDLFFKAYALHNSTKFSQAERLATISGESYG